MEIDCITFFFMEFPYEKFNGELLFHKKMRTRNLVRMFQPMKIN